jgi:hypothetical protein
VTIEHSPPPAGRGERGNGGSKLPTQSVSGEEFVSLLDRHLAWRKRRTVARYERREMSAIPTQEPPSQEAELDRSRRIPKLREGVQTVLLKGPVIPRGFAGP